MSKYTTELRYICNTYGRDEVESWFKDYCIYNYLKQSEADLIINNGVWNPDKLARKIVDHYYMREIGLETPTLFKHYAKVYMQEIMERKLPLIYSASIEYNPLVNVDYEETFDRNIDTTFVTLQTAQSTSTSNGSSLGVESDTPQGQISKTDILNGSYASSTNANETQSSINDSSSTSSNNTNNSEEGYTKKVKGNSGVSATAQKMIQQYRENIIAIDEDIIKELNKLFMGIY